MARPAGGAARAWPLAIYLVACGGAPTADTTPTPDVGASASPREEASTTPPPPTPPPPMDDGTGPCAPRMVLIPGGTYEMAHDGHRVMVGTFCIDATEVTIDAYAACVTAGTCSGDVTTELWEERPFPGPCNYGLAYRKDHPLNCVDASQAETYCRARGGRLPTEAEWAGAARTENFDPEPEVEPCRKGIDHRSGTCRVGRLPAGEVHDMRGNVWEWTSSPYVAKDCRRSPCKPTDAHAVVIRGGDWFRVVSERLPTPGRARTVPWFRDIGLGFRCAADERDAGLSSRLGGGSYGLRRGVDAPP